MIQGFALKRLVYQIRFCKENTIDYNIINSLKNTTTISFVHKHILRIMKSSKILWPCHLITAIHVMRKLKRQNYTFDETIKCVIM